MTKQLDIQWIVNSEMKLRQGEIDYSSDVHRQKNDLMASNYNLEWYETYDP